MSSLPCRFSNSLKCILKCFARLFSRAASLARFHTLKARAWLRHFRKRDLRSDVCYAREVLVALLAYLSLPNCQVAILQATKRICEIALPVDYTGNLILRL